jgi:hypothetical protein
MIFICFVSILYYINGKKITNLRLRIFESDPYIEDICIEEDGDAPLPITIRHLTIIYRDGRYLELKNVDESLTALKHSPMQLDTIGNYTSLVYFFDKDNFYSPHNIPRYLGIKELGERLNIKLQNVIDIIKNYDIIYSYISSVPTLPENLPYENEIIKKFLTEPGYEIIETVDAKYAVFKKRSTYRLFKGSITL